MTSKEAYNLVLHELERNTNFTEDSTFGKAVDMLNDLVERDTPLKIVDTGIGGSYCKKCRKSKHYDSFGNRNNFCGGCGQRLKWSDSDEN